MTRRKYRGFPGSKVRSRMSLQIAGTLDCHPDGYGFVRPDKAGNPDVYVSERNLGEAMHRDRVLVRVIRRKSGGRLEGKVLRVLERKTREIVGFFNGRQVVPRGGQLSNAVWIESRDRGQARAGEIVLARITRYPSGMSGPGGEIIEVLGREGDREVEARAVLLEHGFKDRFPEQVDQLASRVPGRVRPSEFQGRRDLRGISFITIDPASARDFDDAVAIQKTKAGYTLWVSIADVSHYVPPMSALDKEAYERGTSVYFPDRAVPMLPEQLSSGICSLNPRTNRLAMTAEIRFDSNGRRKGFRFYASVIKSRYRLSYDEVRQVILDRNPMLRKKYADAVKSLEIMRELAELRIKQRRKRGSVDLDLPEAEVIFDKNGEVENIVRRERNIAHRMIEEFMLAANEAVADYMTKETEAFVYRVHEPPPAEAVKALDEFLRGLGIRLLGKNKAPERIRPRDYQRVLDAADGKPYQAVVNMLCLRSMMLARYDTKNLGHFGLAAERYCHFTSPIRRYPDLIVHRLLKARLGIPAPEGPGAPQDLKTASEHCSEQERAAESAEREIMDFYATELMAKKIGEEFPGTVSGLTQFGIFVQLDDPFVEGMIPTESLSGDRGRRGDIILDEKKHVLRIRHRGLSFSIGDRVLVEMQDVNPDRRQINLLFCREL
jgi:ribonuclease R